MNTTVWIALAAYILFTFFVPRGWLGRLVVYYRQRKQYSYTIREVPPHEDGGVAPSLSDYAYAGAHRKTNRYRRRYRNYAQPYTQRRYMKSVYATYGKRRYTQI